MLSIIVSLWIFYESFTKLVRQISTYLYKIDEKEINHRGTRNESVASISEWGS